MVKPKKILNDPSRAVSEFLEGLLLQYPNHLSKLANHNVILLAPTQRRQLMDKVQLISGGGSGHEPSHAGWIGTGMLSAAVCGGIFASPAVNSILAAIRAVAGHAGVLLLVKNYTGDRLNFGIACERANQEGIRCAMVIIADDCAIPRQVMTGITGARGVAGTVLIHKIAGAAATVGNMDIDQVASLVRCVNQRMGTIGVALRSVTIPGAEHVNERLEDDTTIEIGLGIHGEAGRRQVSLMSANDMALEMISSIQAHGRIDDSHRNKDGEDRIVPLFMPHDELCILVNNLGGTSNFEMSILARSCIKILEGSEYGANVTHVLVGSYMTSFDMQGVSLTILNVTGQSQWIQFLEASTNAPAWKPCDVWRTGIGTTAGGSSRAVRPSLVEEPEIDVSHSQQGKPLPTVTISSFADLSRRLVHSAAQELSDAESMLTQYDTIVGDGDCGITMKRGATEILRRLQEGTLITNHPVSFFASLADAVSSSMGGTSGVLLELMLRKISSTLNCVEAIGSPELCMAFRAGVDAVSLYGGAQVGARTMLDALVPAAMVVETTLAEAAREARRGADGTASMKTASAGRSNYLSGETLEGTPDPGAIAVAIVLESLAREVSLE